MRKVIYNPITKINDNGVLGNVNFLASDNTKQGRHRRGGRAQAR